MQFSRRFTSGHWCGTRGLRATRNGTPTRDAATGAYWNFLGVATVPNGGPLIDFEVFNWFRNYHWSGQSFQPRIFFQQGEFAFYCSWSLRSDEIFLRARINLRQGVCFYFTNLRQGVCRLLGLIDRRSCRRKAVSCSFNSLVMQVSFIYCKKLYI
nr:hypothetical protein Itr_chr11CG19170 [Ipomoea trifida]